MFLVFVMMRWVLRGISPNEVYKSDTTSRDRSEARKKEYSSRNAARQPGKYTRSLMLATMQGIVADALHLCLRIVAFVIL